MTIHTLPGATVARFINHLAPLVEVVEKAEDILSKAYLTTADKDAVIYLRRAWTRLHKNFALEGLLEFESLRQRLFSGAAAEKVPLEDSPKKPEPSWIKSFQ